MSQTPLNSDQLNAILDILNTKGTPGLLASRNPSKQSSRQSSRQASRASSGFSTPVAGYQTPSYSTSGYQTPMSGYQTPMSGYQTPSYSASGYQTPSYSTSGYQTPSYSASGYQTPSYSASGYQTPSYSASGYQTPSYSTSGYQTPSYSTSGYQTPSDKKEKLKLIKKMMSAPQTPINQDCKSNNKHHKQLTTITEEPAVQELIAVTCPHGNTQYRATSVPSSVSITGLMADVAKAAQTSSDVSMRISVNQNGTEIRYVSKARK